MTNIIKWQKYKDKVFGMKAIIIDLIFYLIILTIAECVGYPKVGVGLIGFLVLSDLVWSYFKGKEMKNG